MSPATKNTLKEVGKNAAIAAVQTLAQKAGSRSTVQSGTQRKKSGSGSRAKAGSRAK